MNNTSPPRAAPSEPGFFQHLVFSIFLAPLTFFFSSVCWLLAPLGRESIVSHRLQCLWARLLLATGGVRVEADLSALPPEGTFVFMANHQSNMDIPALFAILRHFNFRFLAKESLFRIPVFGPAMRRVGHVSIDRENRRKAMESIGQAVSLVSRGVSLLIFPEGTRSRDFSRLGEFKTGGMIVALKCGAPVAPLILTGSGPILPKGAKRLRPGVIRVTALPPFDPSANYTLKDREAFKNDLQALMEAAYQEQSACTAPAK